MASRGRHGSPRGVQEPSERWKNYAFRHRIRCLVPRHRFFPRESLLLGRVREELTGGGGDAPPEYGRDRIFRLDLNAVPASEPVPRGAPSFRSSDLVLVSTVTGAAAGRGGARARPDELDHFEPRDLTLAPRRCVGDDERSLVLRELKSNSKGSGKSNAPHPSP